MTRPKKGYYEPWPVDFLILAILPDVGTIGGVHWKGRRVVDLTDELRLDGASDVDGQLLTNRLRSMATAGHVRSFPGSGNQRIWARTESGVEHLNRKETYLA